MAYEWRARAPRGTKLHKAAVGDPVTFCGQPVAQLSCRAPVDPKRAGQWPLNHCRRCRAAEEGPYSWRAVERVYVDLAAATERRAVAPPSRADPLGGV